MTEFVDSMVYSEQQRESPRLRRKERRKAKTAKLRTLDGNLNLQRGPVHTPAHRGEHRGQYRIFSV